MFEVAIITASDKGAKGLREDLSGPCIKQIVEESDYKVVSMEILNLVLFGCIFYLALIGIPSLCEKHGK